MSHPAPEHRLDFSRPERTGLSEAVLCLGKSAAQINAILLSCEREGRPMLLTRLDASQWQALGEWQGRLDFDPVSGTAAFGRLRPLQQTRQVAVVTGGTADQPVAREAARTLDFHGWSCHEFLDIGVAGLWRLQEVAPELATFEVIICCAGMDAALPTVLAGLLPGLIIAVPTSTGYGRAKAGETALNALLSSCAQGLVVVNIDNGFGAACAALRVLQKA